MNYSEIKALALSYSDREDSEVINRIDDFLKLVETRVNRVLQVQKQVVRTSVLTEVGQEYYSLPDDFLGIRDIEIFPLADANSRTTLSYLSPEQMNNLSTSIGDGNNVDRIYYTIIASQLHILPITINSRLEIVYYRNLVPLTSAVPENWLSKYYPDTYVFGILVEISAFTKSPEGMALWDERFKASVSEIDFSDGRSRWSGTSMTVRTG